MKKLILSIATLLTFSAMFAIAGPANWQIADKYSIRFTGGGEVGGIFKTMKGTIVFDEQTPAGSHFELSIAIASVNTGNGLMNTHIKSAEWFDAGKYPEIKFTSTKIEKTATGYVATGDMDIHGVKKTLSLPFTFQSKGNAGTFAAKFQIYRNDFHLGKPGGEVDDNIKVDISVPVAKK